MLRLIPIAIAATLLAACAGTGPSKPQLDTALASPEPEPVAPPERAFPADSIYPLLVAEFALRRQDYQTALKNYTELSSALGDAGVSRHTAHLAQFVQDDDAALRATDEWLAQDPDSLEAHNTAATLLARRGRAVQALPHMAFIAGAGEQANFPLLLQGFDQLDPGAQATLVQGLNDLAADYPEDPALLLTLALINAEFKQFERALDRLERLFELEGGQHQALLLEARILMQQEDAAPFARIEDQLEDTPEDTRLRLEYAKLLTNTDMAAARRQFEILSAQSPDDADLLLSLALINRETGDDMIARAYLRQVLETGRHGNEAHYYLGRIAEKQKEQDQALAHYMQVGNGRQYLSASQRIGHILASSGQIEACHSWFDHQRESVPARREALYGIEADALGKAGAQARALAVLNRGIEDFPDSSSLLYARSILGQQMGNLAMMEADLRAILARDPNNATALNALGYTLADQTDRLDEAYQLVTRALSLSPGEPAILDSMGWVLYRRGELDEALDYLTRAYAAFPDPEVAAHLGEVLWTRGDRVRAREVWRGGLLSDPHHEVLLNTLQRLGVDDLDIPAPPAGGDPP